MSECICSQFWAETMLSTPSKFSLASYIALLSGQSRCAYHYTRYAFYCLAIEWHVTLFLPSIRQFKRLETASAYLSEIISKFVCII